MTSTSPRSHCFTHIGNISLTPTAIQLALALPLNTGCFYVPRIFLCTMDIFMYPGYFYVPVTVWGKGPRCNFLKNALGVDLKIGRHRDYLYIHELTVTAQQLASG